MFETINSTATKWEPDSSSSSLTASCPSCLAPRRNKPDEDMVQAQGAITPDLNNGPSLDAPETNGIDALEPAQRLQVPPTSDNRGRARQSSSMTH
jgi:hypothetical protein